MAIHSWSQQESREIIGALSKIEISYLNTGLEQDLSDTRGHIVEFGTYMGCSTNLLNQYLRDPELHYCYDRFIYESWMGFGHIGESFYDLFIDNVKDCTRLMIQKGPIKKYKWNHGGIRMMFIDAFKHRDTALHVIKHWFRYMNVGGLILDQDLMFSMKRGTYAYCLLWYYRLRDYMIPFQQADSMIVFKVVKPTDQEYINWVLKTLPTFTELYLCIEYWKGLIDD